ncbi:MAG: prepilin-type N-terminal cleavage/methylation domain-containing protein [Phycisphaerales bacterium]|nr:MAG: prepilin-type N-terminal cleavage/methylation domain-containing protein [Phycisphaerales bacterium]
MNNRMRQHGFTLVELLVAVALIATILSMAYGSYVTTMKSAEACKSRIVLSEQGRKTLERIARHVRCSYAGAVCDDNDDTGSSNDQQETKTEQRVNYFNGDARSPNGEILHLVTTCGLSEDREFEHGLFEVSYRFNRRTRQLATSEVRFVGKVQKTRKRDWKVISDKVESVDLEFFDGKSWLRRWDFTDKKGLPRAVRIEITGRNENLQRYDYSTVAYINVSRPSRPRIAGRMPATHSDNSDGDFGRR